jgi:hypothetical protein
MKFLIDAAYLHPRGENDVKRWHRPAMVGGLSVVRFSVERPNSYSAPRLNLLSNNNVSTVAGLGSGLHLVKEGGVHGVRVHGTASL